jgi:hypothetical protein
VASSLPRWLVEPIKKHQEFIIISISIIIIIIKILFKKKKQLFSFFFLFRYGACIGERFFLGVSTVVVVHDLANKAMALATCTPSIGSLL